MSDFVITFVSMKKKSKFIKLTVVGVGGYILNIEATNIVSFREIENGSEVKYFDTGDSNSSIFHVKETIDEIWHQLLNV